MVPCECAVADCLLCEARLLSGLAEEQVCSVRGLILRETRAPGEFVFHQGSPSRHLYVLKAGCVKLAAALPDGREQVLGIGVEGNLLGFEGFSQEVYPYSAQALTPVHVCGVRRADMTRILTGNPKVTLDVVRVLNAELERSKALIMDLGLRTAPERVASFLLSLVPPGRSWERELSLPLKRREIAEMLGLREETVSRVMAGLRRERVIRTRQGCLQILSLDRLRELAGFAPADVPTGRFATA